MVEHQRHRTTRRFLVTAPRTNFPTRFMPTKPAPASPALEKLRSVRIVEAKERFTRLKRENAVAGGELVLRSDVHNGITT